MSYIGTRIQLGRSCPAADEAACGFVDGANAVDGGIAHAAPTPRTSHGTARTTDGKRTVCAPMTLDAAAARRIFDDKNKLAAILAEKDRMHSNAARGELWWLRHLFRRASEMRSIQDGMRAFIEAVANPDAVSGTARIPLGNGWYRHVRVMNGVQTQLDLRTDAGGVIVDARGPAQFPPLDGSAIVAREVAAMPA
jgi:hypothetical protein